MSRVRLCSIMLVVLAVGMARADKTDDLMLDWVAKYAQELNVRFSKRPFEQIGWAKSVTAALELAKKHQRPIFLFTMDGYFDTGRC